MTRANGLAQVVTDRAPAPVALYSQGVSAPMTGRGSLLTVSGQVGVDASGAVVSETVEVQTQTALRNLREVLGAAGATVADVIRMDCYLTSREDFAAFNEAYERAFAGVPVPPTRTTVFVGLGPGLLVELTATAFVVESAGPEREE